MKYTNSSCNKINIDMVKHTQDIYNINGELVLTVYYFEDGRDSSFFSEEVYLEFLKIHDENNIYYWLENGKPIRAFKILFREDNRWNYISVRDDDPNDLDVEYNKDPNNSLFRMFKLNNLLI